MMDTKKVDALIATSYNLHFGRKFGGESLSPLQVPHLPSGLKMHLVETLLRKGGSDLFNADDCREAIKTLKITR